MNTNHKFNTRNQVEVRQVKAIEVASNILEDLLNLKHRGLTLQAQRQAGWAGSNAWHSGMYVNNESLIKVNFRNLTGATLEQIIEVLGHEFRHAVQYSTGLLRGYQNWTGPALSNKIDGRDSRFGRYWNMPWEIDARAHQKVYAQMVFNDPRFAEFIPYLQEFTGKKPQKVNQDATYALIPFDKEGIQMFTLRSTPKVTYWMHISQIPKCKKWTNKFVKLAFAEYRELMVSQVLHEVMVDITVDDLVS